jgi:hypothetical protein
MKQRLRTTDNGRGAAAEQVDPPVRDPGLLNRSFPLTDMPTWLMLVLVAVGLPRTLLADLGIVAPNGSQLYFFLALAPFAVWLTVAIARRSGRPFTDFLVLGILYGLSLVVVHQLLWGLGPSLGHRPPEGAVRFAEQFAPAWQDLALRGYTVAIAMLIGVGTGVVAGLVALVAHLWRSGRGRSNPGR